MDTNNKYYYDVDKLNYLQVFNRYPITLERGKGARVWDVEGNEYIDALAGIAVNSAGHCHPVIIEAIRSQSEKLIHISNFYLSKPQVILSEKLTTLSGLERVFMTNSGAESVEGAIKLARKYAHTIGRGGTILSFEGSFHGRTMATIATGKKTMQKGFEPIPGGFKQIPFNNIDAVKAAAKNDVAAILIEPIQGEGGINLADKQFMHDLRQLCTESDILLIFDEIQCGMGRTGKMFAKEHYGVQPDIMTLAKALGGGFPIGAVLCNRKVNAVMKAGEHGTTFGGNPIGCAAALATIHVIEEEMLMKQAEEKGEWMKKEIAALNDGTMREVRGLGLMIGVEFDFETKPLVAEMLNRNILANATAGNVLRLVPPLNIEWRELEQILNVLEQSLEKVKAHA
jgi:acetylornithine/N-succinyldiaminopimelate aminotransferase